jgi:hypothetical protein
MRSVVLCFGLALKVIYSPESAVRRGVRLPEMKTIELPAELCAGAEKRYGSVFASLEELLVFVLKDLTNDDALKADQIERQMVEERLRDLGYR